MPLNLMLAWWNLIYIVPFLLAVVYLAAQRPKIRSMQCRPPPDVSSDALIADTYSP